MRFLFDVEQNPTLKNRITPEVRIMIETIKNEISRILSPLAREMEEEETVSPKCVLYFFIYKNARIVGLGYSDQLAKRINEAITQQEINHLIVSVQKSVERLLN